MRWVDCHLRGESYDGTNNAHPLFPVGVDGRNENLTNVFESTTVYVAASFSVQNEESARMTAVPVNRFRFLQYSASRRCRPDRN